MLKVPTVRKSLTVATRFFPGGSGGGGSTNGNNPPGQGTPGGQWPPQGCEQKADGTVWCPETSTTAQWLVGLGFVVGGGVYAFQSQSDLPAQNNGFHFPSGSACYNAFSDTTVGKVVEFLSPAQIFPGFNPRGGALEAFIEDVGAGGVKFGGVRALAKYGPNALEALSVTGGKSVVQAGVPKAGAQVFFEVVDTSAAAVIGLAPLAIDLGARLGCAAFY